MSSNYHCATRKYKDFGPCHTPFSVQACADCHPLLCFSPCLFVTTHAQFVKMDNDMCLDFLKMT